MRCWHLARDALQLLTEMGSEFAEWFVNMVLNLIKGCKCLYLLIIRMFEKIG